MTKSFSGSTSNRRRKTRRSRSKSKSKKHSSHTLSSFSSSKFYTTTVKNKDNKVIGEGGFGCVVNPNISCKMANGKTVPSSRRYITKIMEPDDFEKEFEDVRNVKSILKNKIPNHKHFFLLDIHECKPEKVHQSTISTIQEGCKYFKDKTQEDLEEMNTLLMPYAGKRSDKFLEDNRTVEQYKSFHSKLLYLLRYGIIKMNEANVYHCDIKLQNVLFNKNKFLLIDWGFSYIHQPNSFSAFDIPTKFIRYPLHFNMPITVCLFGETILKSVKRKIETQRGSKLDFEEIAKYAWSLVKTSRKGHYEILVEQYDRVKSFTETKTFDEFAIETYKLIFIKYTNIRTRHLDLYSYFKDFYLPNVDLYGTMVCYMNFMEIIDNNQNNSLFFSLYTTFYLKKIDKRELLENLRSLKI